MAGNVIDFRGALDADRCWDRKVDEIHAKHGEPLDDCILQNREELVGLCEFIERHEVRSYLEIGVWTGRLVSTLHRLFRFDRVAACDQGYAERFGLRIHLPDDATFFRGDSDSDAFLRWRRDLGPVDLVFIDANHAYHAVCRDVALQRTFPHRFLALHDITGASRHTVGVRRAWEEIEGGHKLEIVRPHAELGLSHSIMGIGIWSESEVP